MNAFSKSALAIALLTASISALAQQPDPLTQFEVKGHVRAAPANGCESTRSAQSGKGARACGRRIVGTFRKAP
jgi:hypothetical protein